MVTEPFDLESETLTRARGGDVEAGLYALSLCVPGLYLGRMSEKLRFYLAECLQNIVDGMPVDRALCVENERASGRPTNPFPDWEEPLAAVAALLTQRGYRPERVNAAMSDARELLEGGTTLDRREAQKIRQKYLPMLAIEEGDLLALCPPELRGLLERFPRRPPTQ
jgi:hypothetical protein